MMRRHQHAGARLLSYFGERYEPPCGNCDRRLAGEGHRPVPDGPYPVGARVVHGSFGEGEVVRYEERKVIVVFDEVGYQSLALGVVEENDLLRVVD